MANTVKYYKSGGTDPTRDYILASSAGNTPFGTSEISREQAQQIATQYSNFRILPDQGSPEQGRTDLFSSMPTQGMYTTDPNTGTLTTQANINQQQANIQGVQAGTMKEDPNRPGYYYPTGSNAQQLAGGTLTPQEITTSTAQSLSQSGVLPTSATQTRPVNTQAQSATNLYDFFTAMGSSLPSISQRAVNYQRLTGKSGYQGTVAQNNELLGIYKSQGNMGTPVAQGTATNTMSTDLLGNKTGLNIGGVSDNYNYGASASGAMTKVQTPAEQAVDATGKRITDAIASMGNQQGDLIAQQNALGVPEKQKALDDVLAQARALQAQVLQQNETLRNQAIPTPFIIGQQNELNRTAAIQLNSLAAIAETLRGNYESAKQSAKDYIDAKYAQKEAELKAYEFQQTMNQDALIREDKAKYEQNQLSLELRKEALDIQKTADAQAFQKELLALNAKYESQALAQKHAYDVASRSGGGGTTTDSSGNVIPAQNELKTNALNSAKTLLDKFNKGEGTSAVGTSGTLNSFGYGLIPGTQRADFVVQFNNLKSLLALDNVKYLKGQGQVSDAERRLLEQASAKLDLSQSEGEFKKSLTEIYNTLSGTPGTIGAQTNNSNITPIPKTTESFWGNVGNWLWGSD